MIVGFAIVAIMMVGVVVDASAAYLRRSGLDSLADGAALAAADGIQGRQVYEGGLGERARDRPARSPARTSRLPARRPGRPGATRGSPTTSTPATDRVVVHVAAPLDLPITPPGWERRPVDLRAPPRPSSWSATDRARRAHRRCKLHRSTPVRAGGRVPRRSEAASGQSPHWRKRPKTDSLSGATVVASAAGSASLKRQLVVVKQTPLPRECDGSRRDCI